MGYFTVIFNELMLLGIWIRILMCHAHFSKHALLLWIFQRHRKYESSLSVARKPRIFLLLLREGSEKCLNTINSFIKEVHSVKGPNRIVYQRCLDVAMSWIKLGSAALITLEWLVLVKVSVRSDQCLCWGLWLSNGAYPNIFHSLCLTHTHTHTNII